MAWFIVELNASMELSFQALPVAAASVKLARHIIMRESYRCSARRSRSARRRREEARWCALSPPATPWVTPIGSSGSIVIDALLGIARSLLHDGPTLLPCVLKREEPISKL